MCKLSTLPLSFNRSIVHKDAAVLLILSFLVSIPQSFSPSFRRAPIHPIRIPPPPPPPSIFPLGKSFPPERTPRHEVMKWQHGVSGVENVSASACLLYGNGAVLRVRLIPPESRRDCGARCRETRSSWKTKRNEYLHLHYIPVYVSDVDIIILM